MNSLKFIADGKSFLGRHYHLEMDGVKIGYAVAKVRQDATGWNTKTRYTSYSATVTVLDNRTFGGLRSTVKREIERALAAVTK
jgi:hypothetical protein